MLIAFFVNDMATEHVNYTTTVLAFAATQRGHRVCYLTPSDFALRADDSMCVHARFAPRKKHKDHARLLRGDEGGRGQDRDDRRHRGRRADAAQRSVARRPGDALGGRHRHPVRPRGGEARRARPQRSRQPRPGDQQALFPVLSRGGPRRDADHPQRRRREGLRQGAWRQRHPEAAAGLGRLGRVQGRHEVQIEPQPDDRGDRARRLHHRPGLCAGGERRATSACS